MANVTTTLMDSADIAQRELDPSDAALVGHYWDPAGNTVSPLAFSIYDRQGVLTPVTPAAIKVLGSVDLFWSPLVIGGHDLLGVQVVSVDLSRYIRLDLRTGKVTTLLTATNLLLPLPSGASGGEPHEVNMTSMGTTSDSSIARVMVVQAVVNGVRIPGAAYFDIDLRSLEVTGPHALPNVGPQVISADGRYLAWTQWSDVPGSAAHVLHVRDLASGHETAIADVPYYNEAAHAGIKFSPDDSYITLQGYGASSSMGLAIFDLRSNVLVQSFKTPQPDEVLQDVPVWWTDGRTIVYQTTAASGVKQGHRLDVITGALVDYSLELGAPVLMLSAPQA